MTVLHSISELRSVRGPVALAIGVFDGVHRGHQEVIRAALEFAGQHGGSAVVMTFDPHPLRLLRPEAAPNLLCSTSHKLRILAGLGVETVLLCPFDRGFAQTAPRDFIEALARSCQPLGYVSVGYTWRFGRSGAGDIHLLMDQGQKFGFGVYGVPPVRLGGVVVSSTTVRDAVAAGDFGRAREFLGRDYTVFGRVIEGGKLGRKLGFPTANLDIETEQLPPGGVYVVRATLDGEWLPAVANLGHRPTVAGANAPLTLEVHLIDFNGEIYGRDMEVGFISRLRHEQKFAGIEELRRQIAADLKEARRRHGLA